MKALAIDSAVSKMTIAAKNDDKFVTLTLDIGMRQSEKILPAIDYVLKELDLTCSDLDYTTLTKGPGSFTGLRLAFSALKAIELSNEKPIYGVSTLDSYAYPFRNFNTTVLCVIDAKKEKFYANAKNNGKEILASGDYEIQSILDALKSEKDVFVVGPDAKYFTKMCKANTSTNFFYADENTNCTSSLFSIAEDMIEKEVPALKEYEGPEYLRASEAEEHLISAKA